MADLLPLGLNCLACMRTPFLKPSGYGIGHVSSACMVGPRPCAAPHTVFAGGSAKEGERDPGERFDLQRMTFRFQPFTSLSWSRQYPILLEQPITLYPKVLSAVVSFYTAETPKIQYREGA